MSRDETASSVMDENDPSAAPGPSPGVPPHIQVMQMIMAAAPARALAALADLGVPDALGDKRQTAAEVAAVVGGHGPWVLRLMRAAASVGVLRCHEDGSFENTKLGHALRSDTPNSVRALGVLVDQPFHFNAWAVLADGIRTGEVPFERVHHRTFFDYLREHPGANATFAAWMTQSTVAQNDAILRAYDFSASKTVVDVGGGQGSLLTAVLTRHPHTHGIVYDLPEVVKDASQIEAAGVGDRYQSVGGDFFASVPAGDVLLLKMVLHDWDDDACVTILGRCRDAIRDQPDARLLVIEMVLPDDCSPHPGFFMDINMMVFNHGGRERTQSEYASLFDRAGFRVTQVLPTLGPYTIIEASVL